MFFRPRDFRALAEANHQPSYRHVRCLHAASSFHCTGFITLSFTYLNNIQKFSGRWKQCVPIEFPAVENSCSKCDFFLLLEPWWRMPYDFHVRPYVLLQTPDTARGHKNANLIFGGWSIGWNVIRAKTSLHVAESGWPSMSSCMKSGRVSK